MIPPGTTDPDHKLLEDCEKYKNLTIKILPPTKDCFPFYRTTRVHKVAPGCPACAAGIPVKARSIKPVERYYHNVIARPGRETALVMDVSPKVHKKLMEHILGTDQYEKYRSKAEAEIKSVVPSKRPQYRSIDDDWEGW